MPDAAGLCTDLAGHLPDDRHDARGAAQRVHEHHPLDRRRPAIRIGRIQRRGVLPAAYVREVQLGDGQERHIKKAPSAHQRSSSASSPSGRVNLSAQAIHVGPVRDPEHVDNSRILVDPDQDAVGDADVSTSHTRKFSAERFGDPKRVVREVAVAEAEYSVGQLGRQPPEGTNRWAGQPHVEGFAGGHYRRAS